MKKGKKTASLLLLILFASIKSHAYDFEVDGIYYGYDVNTQSVYVTSGDKDYQGVVTIPSSITFNGKTLDVTAIGQKAFYRCYGVESVSLPNSVTRIEDSAFEGCGLKTVNIPKGITTIGYFAFADSYLTKVFIPNSVTIISAFAFQPCSQLETVIIEDSETPIEYWDYNSFVNSQSSQETTPKYVYIGRDCYSKNGSLNSLTINCSNAKILSIGKYVRCVETSSLVAKIVYSASEIPEEVKVNFNGSIYSNAKLYVPTGTKEKYMTTEGWKNFYDIEEMAVDKMWNGQGNPPDNNQENSIATIRGNAIFIKSYDGIINVSGADDGETVSIYTTAGIMVGKDIVHGGNSSISTNIRSGEIAIIRIGNNSVKVVMQ